MVCEPGSQFQGPGNLHALCADPSWPATPLRLSLSPLVSATRTGPASLLRSDGSFSAPLSSAIPLAHPPSSLSCRVFSWSLFTPVCGITTLSSTRVWSSRLNVQRDISTWVSHDAPQIGLSPALSLLSEWRPQLLVPRQKSRSGAGDLLFHMWPRGGDPFPSFSSAQSSS